MSHRGFAVLPAARVVQTVPAEARTIIDHTESGLLVMHRRGYKYTAEVEQSMKGYERLVSQGKPGRRRENSL